MISCHTLITNLVLNFYLLESYKNYIHALLILLPFHQRVAISTVERIYLETLHFESPFPLVCVEAIPMLCNLLQYEDPQVPLIGLEIIIFQWICLICEYILLF